MKKKLTIIVLVISLTFLTPDGIVFATHLLEYDAVFSAPVEFGCGATYMFDGTAHITRIPLGADIGSVGSIVGDVDWEPETVCLPCGIPCGIIVFIATMTLVLWPAHNAGELVWDFGDGITASREYAYVFDDVNGIVTATGSARMDFEPGFAQEIVAARDFVLTISSTGPGEGLETGIIEFEKQDGSVFSATMVGHINFEDPGLELAEPRIGLIEYDIDVETGNFAETVTLIPEPTTVLLLSLGGLLLRRRKYCANLN